MAKMKKNKEMFDRTEFPELLSTLSINEVNVLEFRFVNCNKWEKMVACTDQQRRVYLCNVCNVIQYSEKNLFSHLFGKKHFQKMETVKQIRLSKVNEDKAADKKGHNTQLKTESKNLEKTPDIKNTRIKDANSKYNANITIRPSNPYVPTVSKPISTKQVPNKIETKTSKAETVITKKSVGPNKELALKPNLAVEAPKKEVVAKPNLPVGAPKKNIVPKPDLPAGAPKIDLSSKPKTASEVPKKDLVTKPKIVIEAPKKDLVTKPNISVESRDPVKISNDKHETANSTEKNKQIIECKSNLVQCDSIPPILNSSSCSVNESEDKLKATPNLQANVAKVISDQLVQKETKPKDKIKNVLYSSSQSNVVINPLSKAAAIEKTITCVPISKLLSESNEADNDVDADADDDDIVMTVPESPSNEIHIDSHKNDKLVQNYKVAEKVVTSNKLTTNYLPTSNSMSSTFESGPNMTEILGLLGVEYVLKIVKNISDSSPRFLCSLCNITTNELSMHNHLLSNTHRLKYCEKHFPTAIRQYKQYISEVPEHQVYKILTPILNKLAIAIEKHHGRESSYLCYDYWFNKNQNSLISTVFNRRHASEVLGPTFTHVIDSREVDILIENTLNRIDQPSNVFVANNEAQFNPYNNSSNMFQNHPAVNNYHHAITNTNYVHNNEDRSMETVDDETHKRMVENFLRDTRQAQPVRHRNSTRVSKRVRSRSTSPDRKRKRTTPVIISQWNMDRRSISPLRDGDIWQAYRHMVDHSVRELNTTFDVYKSDPEEHPQYKDEWQKFWKRRKDELIAAGINHRSYNFQGEWILFFNARLEELYNQDVENIKVKCRERLCLPMTNNELTNPKYHVNISDDLSEPESPPNKESYKNTNEIRSKHSESIEDVNVIHVLRLLTALENYLGSLGPNITEMLAKSLQISKQYPDKINHLILTNENCAILETAKEKFTGLIISKILDSNQERALKRAVKDTESLLAYAAEMRKQVLSKNVDPEDSTAEAQSKSDSGITQRSSSNVSIKMSDQINKSGLAARLASSLISQGKTKINHDQLKQIIQVYAQIEQKKQQETTASTRTASNVLKQNKAPNDLAFHGSSTNNKFAAQNQCQQLYDAPNYNSDHHTFTNQKQYMTSSLTSDLYNMKTSSNYFSANMARTNNSNINRNPNEMECNRSGQESQYKQYDDNLFDSGQFAKKRNNPSSLYMDSSYSFGPTDKNTGMKSKWM